MSRRRWPVFAWPAHWWKRQSLRARLTLVSTALFAVAVATGAVLLLVLQRYALIHVLDSSAEKSASDIATQVAGNPTQHTVAPTTGGVSFVQVVDPDDSVIAWSDGADRYTSVLTVRQLAQARQGERLDVTSSTTGARLRVLAQNTGNKTVLVVTDLSRVDDSLRILTRAALIGGPIGVLLMGLATYIVVALTLRPVATLRHGAADITAAGLADQRLPLPSAQDEIHRLAVTLNAMLDRIDSATSRQRTFVGDAAHELRSPLASLRVQLEVTQRLGPATDWPAFIDDIMVDVNRLDRLVADLLLLAKVDESGYQPVREPVAMSDLVDTVVAGYRHARVPVRVDERCDDFVLGDADALRRVLVNLVDNAVRYALTEVQLGAHCGTVDGEPALVLTVADDGEGIAPVERERVFSRFYRVEASRSRESGGTGLGLPIVRDVVRGHGGTIRLTGRDDHRPGLTAVITLPLASDPH